MNQQSKEIIKKIAQVRKSNGVKPEEMAAVLKISEEQYKKMERGAGEITLSQVFLILEILKIHVGSLFEENEPVTHTSISRGITEVTITIKSQDPIDIQSEISKNIEMVKQTRRDEILKRQGLVRRRW
jgi:transcriptional regulator with XRE-family HTH domain